MNDVFNWILVTLALGYVSGLLFARFSNSGMARRKVWLKLGELWITFAVIIGALAGARSMLGTVRTTSTNDEMSQQWNNFTALALYQQVLMVVMLLAALVLFIRVFSSLRSLDNGGRTPEGKDE